MMNDERQAKVVLTADTSGYTQGMQQARGVTDGLNTSIGQISDSINTIQKSVARGLFKVGAADIASFSAMSAIAATLEKQTSDIQANFAVLGRSSQQVDQVVTSIRTLSRELPMARSQVAALATEVSNLGVTSSRQIDKVTTQFAKMGIATGEMPAALASSMVQFQRTMGYVPTAAKMEPSSQAATYLSAKAGAPAGNIIGFAQSIAPAARVAGLNETSVLGISAAANRTGADGMYAATTISQILNTISTLRQTGSPDIKRFANALGMSEAQLRMPTRPETPEQTDKFMRGIIDRIVKTADDPNGIAKLQMMGIDGIRGRRALQSFAAEGSVERWIAQAQYGKTTDSIGTGYKAASDGLIDEMEKLRNKFTDMGQSFGQPMMEAFTAATKGANVFAEGAAKAADIMGKGLGTILPLLGAGAIGVGVPFFAWRAMNRMSLARRGINNVATSYGRTGFRVGQQQALGTFDESDWTDNEVMKRYKAGNAGLVGDVAMQLGGAFGSFFPYFGSGYRDRGFSRGLRGADRFIQWMGRESQFHYEQAGRTGMEGPILRQQARDERDRIADEIRRRRATGQSLLGIKDDKGKQVNIKDYAYVGPERVRMRDLIASAVGESTDTAFAAGRYGVKESWGLLRSHPGSFKNLGTGLAYGGAAAASSIIGAGAAVAAPMAIVAGAGYAYDQYQKQQEYNKQFKTKEGSGLTDEGLDALQAYNDELGVATAALSRFAQGLDKTNPARTEDPNKELRDDANVRDVGRAQEKLTNEKVGLLKTTWQAEEFLAAQGPMSTDELVLLFRDLAKQFKRPGQYEGLRDWYLSGGPDKAYLSGTDKQRGLSQMMLGDYGAWMNADYSVGEKLGVTLSTFGPGGWDLGNLKEKNKMSTELLVGSILSKGRQTGEYVDTSTLKGDNEQAKADAVSLASNISYASDALGMALDQVKKSNLGNREISIERGNALKDSLVKELNLDPKDFENIDFNKMFRSNKSADELKSEIYKTFADAIKSQAPYNADAQAAVDSGLFNFKNAEEAENFFANLGKKKTSTSVETTLGETVYGNMSKEDRDKYFGKDTVLEKAMANGLADSASQWKASADLLNATTKLTDGSIKGVVTALQEFKSATTEGTQAWNIANAAISMFARQNQWRTLGSPTQALGYEAEVSQGYLDNLAGQAPSDDARDQAETEQQKWLDIRANFYQKVQQFGKSRQREADDWKVQEERRDFNFYLGKERQEEAHQRQITRSRGAFQRNLEYSEASFYRNLKYQRQDFYRSREREEEAHQRQMRYMAEDAAKSMSDPYNRMNLQMLSDPNAMQVNMESRLNMLSRQNQNIESLKGRGLSDTAIQQLDLTNFNNAQQTQHLANTMTDADIAKFNQIAEDFVKQAGSLNQQDPAFKRSEQERAISLQQSLEDFVRTMKRTKTEHNIQVSFSKREFEIGIRESTKEFRIGLQNAQEDYDRAVEQSRADRKKALDRQVEDTFDLFNKEIKDSDDLNKKMMDTIVKYGGDRTKEIQAQVKIINDMITNAEKRLNAINEGLASQNSETRREDRNANRPNSYPSSGSGRGAAAVSRAQSDDTNVPGMCLNQVSRWYGGPGIGNADNATEAWNKSKKKHRGDRNPPAGVPVYWLGGDGHVALSLGGGMVRTTDWPKRGKIGTVSIGNLTRALGKPYAGWAEDLWGSGIKVLGDGGIVTKPSRAIIAERGTAEAVIPLDRRGVDFMLKFQNQLANEMLRKMPRTPTSNMTVINKSDHSQHLNVEKVEVVSNDPAKFAKELQREAQKKRAALYKS